MFSGIRNLFNKGPQVEIDSSYNPSPEPRMPTKVEQTAAIIKKIAELQPKFRLGMMTYKTDIDSEVRCFHVRLPSLMRGPGHREENHIEFQRVLDQLVQTVVMNLADIKKDLEAGNPLDKRLRYQQTSEKLDGAINLLSRNIEGTLRTALRPVGVKDMTVRRYLKQDNSRLEKVQELVNAAQQFQKDSSKEGPASSSGTLSP